MDEVELDEDEEEDVSSQLNLCNILVVYVINRMLESTISNAYIIQELA